MAFNTVYHANFGCSLDINDAQLLELRNLVKERFGYSHYTIFPQLFPYLMYIFEYLPLYQRIKKRNKAQAEYYRENPLELEKIIDNCNEENLSNDPSFQVCYIDYLLYLLDYAKNAKIRLMKHKQCLIFLLCLVQQLIQQVQH